MNADSLLCLADEVLINIFLHVDNPTFFAVTCRTFHSIAHAENNIIHWFLLRNQPFHVAFHILTRAPRLFTPTLILSLLERGVPISRYFAQFLVNCYGSPRKHYSNDDMPNELRSVACLSHQIKLPAYCVVINHAAEKYGDMLFDNEFEDDNSAWVRNARIVFDATTSTLVDPARVEAAEATLKKLFLTYNFRPSLSSAPSPAMMLALLAFHNQYEGVFNLLQPMLALDREFAAQTMKYLLFMSLELPDIGVKKAIERLGFEPLDKVYVRHLLTFGDGDIAKLFLAHRTSIPLKFDFRELARELICHRAFHLETDEPFTPSGSRMVARTNVQKMLYKIYPCYTELEEHLRINGYIFSEEEERTIFNHEPLPPHITQRHFVSLLYAQHFADLLGEVDPLSCKCFDSCFFHAACRNSILPGPVQRHLKTAGIRKYKVGFDSAFRMAVRNPLHDDPAHFYSHRLHPHHIHLAQLSSDEVVNELFEWIGHEVEISRHYQSPHRHSSSPHRHRQNISALLAQKNKTDHSLDDWFTALERAWNGEEQKRIIERRSRKTTLQLGLERFIGIGTVLKKGREVGTGVDTWKAGLLVN